MNFVFLPYNYKVPQWQQFYYDQQILFGILSSIETKLLIIQKLKNACQSEDLALHPKYVLNKQNIQQLIEQQFQIFYKYARQQQKLVSLFLQYKMFQIDLKIQHYTKLIDVIKFKSQQMLLLLQNLFIQSYYIHNAIEKNKIIKIQMWDKINHLLIMKDTQYSHSQETKHHMTFNRIMKLSLKMQQKIQRIYVFYSFSNNKNSTPNQFVERQFYKKNKINPLQTFFIGLTMGGLVAFIAILVMFLVINDSILGQDQTFTSNFPTWRGASQVIFYIWVLGFCVLLFEKKNISYKLIFYNQSFNLPHSKYFLLTASAFSCIFFILFIVFLLQLTKTLTTNFIFYGQIFWIILFAYIFNPFPILHFRGRYHLLKLFGKIIISPCLTINFIIIWMSQQLVSLIQIASDLFFTIFYFSSKDIDLTKLVVPNFQSGYTIMIFVYRMIQNLKFWYQNTQARQDKKYDFWAPPFLGFIRALLSFFTAITATVYRLKLFPGALYLWLANIIISTLVAWFVDVKGDWGLFNLQKKTLLRTKLTFPRYVYFIIILINLLLRTAWVFTISPFVLNSEGVWPVLFVMLITMIQVFRRGIWNIFRIQYEHVRNVQQLQATVRDKQILKVAQKKAELIQKNKWQSISQQEHQQYYGSSMKIIVEHFEYRNVNSKNKQKLAIQDQKLKKQRLQHQKESLKYFQKLRNQSRDHIQELLMKYNGTVQQIVKSLNLVSFL